jgi:hypothetical protein
VAPEQRAQRRGLRPLDVQPDELRPRPVRRDALVSRASTPEHARLRSVRPREELLDRARLPDSGVADDGDELALPRRCHTQARLERTDLPLPADEEASRGADRCPGIAHGLRPSASTCPMVKNAAGSRHHSRKPAAMVASSALLAMPYSSAPLARFESVVRSAHEVAHASTES